jgi:hypothetical protein
VSLQKKALATVPSIPKEGVTDVRLLETRQEKLVEAIRALRPNAKRGDLFTPEIAKMFTTTIQTVLRGANAVDVRETILGEGNPANPESPAVVRLTVNAVYPAGAPLSTMPPSLLLVLPSLPKGVEYRFVGRNLILLDTHANLIVDIAPNAFTHETITSKQSRL